MQNPLDIFVSGRVMLLLAQLGIRNARCLAVYSRAVGDAIRHVSGQSGLVDLGVVEPLLREQLGMLERALRDSLEDRSRRQPAAGRGAAAVPPPERPATTDIAGGNTSGDEMPADADVVEILVTVDEPAPAVVRAAKQPSGYVPTAKSMEEKLKDERQPVQQLLREDCVNAGLVDKATADKLIAGMTGKTSQQAELEIVEFLRQRLQDQVKSFIRKSKGGPWSDPHTQEDLRQDIHAAKSVRSVLMLSHQVTKEYQVWKKEHGHGGILGLFSPRKRTVQR